jgi:hypothetical protein
MTLPSTLGDVAAAFDSQRSDSALHSTDRPR